MGTFASNLQRLRHQADSRCRTCEPRCLTDKQTKRGQIVLSDEYVIFDNDPHTYHDDNADFEVNDSDVIEVETTEDVAQPDDDDFIVQDPSVNGEEDFLHDDQPGDNDFIVQDPRVNGEEDFVPDRDADRDLDSEDDEDADECSYV